MFFAIFLLWIFSGALAFKILKKQSDIPEEYAHRFYLFCFAAGPLVIAGFYVYTGFCSAKNKLFALNQDLLSKKMTKINLEILNARGQNALQSMNSRDSKSMAVYIVKKIIYQGLCKRASDIFIDPKADGSYTVRIRVDGVLKIIEEIKSELGPSVISTIKVASSMDITEHRRPQDGSFSVNSDKGKASFRVASVGAFGGEKITIRILGSESGPKTLEECGLTGEDLALVRNAINLSSGMILVCGPTGSGKTTTLYGMLNSIDYHIKNVISIEDPIEKVLPNISQVEINAKANITFAGVLRNTLRQNPDIICLGEIRDQETAEIAVQAAQTGHLIIATVHSNDNIGTINRLVDLGIPLRTIASVLHVVISQRLVRRLCKCARPGALSPAEENYFDALKLKKDRVKQIAGCSECDNSGYRGRIAIFDILKVDQELKMLLENEHANMSVIKSEIQKKYGSSVMAYKGSCLVAQGMTTMDEVRRVTME